MLLGNVVVLHLIAVVVVVNGVNGVNGDDGCRSVASKTSFLTPDTFGHDVSHGIHSITVEDIDLFFGVDVSGVDSNGIPTANLNISDVENPVVDNAPLAGYDKVRAFNSLFNGDHRQTGDEHLALAYPINQLRLSCSQTI